MNKKKTIEHMNKQNLTNVVSREKDCYFQLFNVEDGTVKDVKVSEKGEWKDCEELVEDWNQYIEDIADAGEFRLQDGDYFYVAEEDECCVEDILNINDAIWGSGGWCWKIE